MKKAILVLGPPRSGTSALSHVLSKLGVNFGDPRRFVDPEVNQYNPIFFELRSLNDLNDEIFKHFNKQFDQFNWLPQHSDFDSEVVSLFEPKIAALITAEFSNPQTIGLKDPRFCCTLPLWDAALNRLGYAVSYVLTRRSSDAVFTSNANINRYSDAVNFRLVAQSNLLARHFVEDKKFLTIRYEDLLENPEATITRLCDSLGLDHGLAGAARSVIRQELNHQKEPPRPARFQYFARMLDTGSISPDDQIYYREIYSAAVAEKEQKIAALSDGLSKCEGQRAQIQQQYASFNQLLSKRNRRIAELEQSLQKHDTQVADFERNLQARDSQVAHLARTVAAYEQSASWRMTRPARAVMRIVRRIKRAVEMSTAILLRPRETRRTMREVASTPVAAVQERLQLLSSSHYVMQTAKLQRRSPKLVDAFTSFTIILLRLKLWWAASPRRNRIANKAVRFLRGEIKITKPTDNGQFRTHVDKPTWLVTRVKEPFVVSGWSVDLQNRAAAKVRICVGRKVYVPSLTTREDVRTAFGGVCELPLDTGFSAAPAIPLGLHRMRIDVQHDDGFWIPVRRALLFRTPSLRKKNREGSRRRYDDWIRIEQKRLKRELSEIKRHLDVMIDKPKFTVVVDARQGTRGLDDTLQSIRKQVYPHWDVRLMSGPTNGAGSNSIPNMTSLEDLSLGDIQSEFVVLMQSGQCLAVNALYEFAAAINHHPDIDLVYGDEDTRNAMGRRCKPFYKPDWSPDYLETFNYIGFPACFRTAVARGCFDDAHAYDFVLRFTEKTTRVRHLAKILGHTVEGSLARTEHTVAQNIGALQGRLSRTNRNGTVEEHDVHPGCYRIQPELSRRPLVSIVIPTAAMTVAVGERQIDLIKNVVAQIRERSTYEPIEIIVVDNGDLTASQARTLDLHNCQRITYSDRVFNVSRKLNLGASIASGELLLLINDDLEILTPSWIERMVAHFEKPHVGVVGAKLLYPDGRTQHVGVVHNYGNPDHVRRLYGRDDGGYFFSTCGVRNYLAVTGACMMTPASVFRKVGGYSEELAVSFNDVDYCLKVRSEGFWTVYAPDVELTHMESMSRVPSADRREIAWYRRRWAAETAVEPFYNEQFLAVAPPTFEPGVNPRLL